MTSRDDVMISVSGLEAMTAGVGDRVSDVPPKPYPMTRRWETDASSSQDVP